MRRKIPSLTFTLCLIAALGSALPAQAAPRQYVLQAAQSSVAFETDFGPDAITGSMPVARADLTLDFEAVGKSRIDVELDVTGAQASFPFAAQALKGPKVLDARAHPRMRFVSTKLRASGDTADVTGDLTIRGVTRPVTLKATLYRQQGYAEGDRSHLTIRLTGRVNRSDYGATGWNDMVADEVRLAITARIVRVE